MTFEELLGQRYEILEQVGSGGQGTVFRAGDGKRTVALKIYALDESTDRDDLVGEVDVLLQLRPHPNLPIVRNDFFLTDRYVIVMDWVEGENLQHVLDVGGDPGLRYSRVVDYVTQAADALDHLHGHEPPVVHGDVKPANLILRPDGRVILVDFGIAGDRRLRTGKGTRGYRAPEVAAGSAPTSASDVYGLAATAYALFTGRAPDGQVPAWTGIEAGVVDSVERTVRRGLSIQPSSRQVTAGELAEGLRDSPLPTGDVTLMLTELSDANRLWEDQTELMRSACSRLDDITAEVVEARRGRIIRGMGESESNAAVFRTAADAVAAAWLLHQRVTDERWALDLPIRIRVGVHSGAPESRLGRYTGPVVALTARLRGIAEPSTTIVSEACAQLAGHDLPAGTTLADLGERILPDSSRPHHVFRLEAASAVPPDVRTPDPTPLAVPTPAPAPVLTPAPAHPPSPEPHESLATAAISPSALVIGGGAAAIAIVAGAALPIIVLVAVAGWGGRVVFALRRGRQERIDPYTLGPNWRPYVLRALDSQTRYRRACRNASDGPLRERLEEIGRRVDASVEECWRVARRGDTITTDVERLDIAQTHARYEVAQSELRASPSPTREQTVDSLRAKIDAAERLLAAADDARVQLELLNARLQEAVAHAVELSNRTDSSTELGQVGSDIDGLVGDLRALGQGLDEATGASRRANPGRAS